MARKKKQEPEAQFSKGDWVVFNGWSDPDSVPDDGAALEEGTAYEVAEVGVDGEGQEIVYSLSAPNPEFDDSKRKSKNNPETVLVDVFEDEVAPYEEEEGEEEEGEEEEGEEEEESEEEEEGEEEEESEEEEGEEEEESEEPETAISQNDKFWLPENEYDQDMIAQINEYEDPNDFIQDVAADSAESDYKLGAGLHYVYSTKAYANIEEYSGAGGFKAYVEEHVGITYKMAMNHIQVYVAFRRAGIGTDRIREIGWTKCLEISRYIDEENAETLIDLAQEPGQTVANLSSTLKENFNQGGGGTTSSDGQVFTRTTFKFRLLDAMGDMVQSILDMAGDSLNSMSDEDTFAHIMIDWANQNLDEKQTKKVATLKRKADKEAAAYEKSRPATKSSDEEEEAPKATKKKVAKKAASKKKVTKKAPASKVASKKTASKKTTKKKVAAKG